MKQIDNKYFIITIDTEADNQWDSSHDCSTLNVKFLPRFQELAEKYGFKPTWLTTYEMANDGRFVRYFKKKQDNGLCEIGMHLHAWNTPPEYKLDSKTENRSYLIEYPLEIIDEKIKNLDRMLTKRFGVKPISHRAGRWAMNDDYFKILGKYGYKVDCSITPHINWNKSLGETGIPGSNYEKYNEKPLLINNILEVPMTIRKVHQIQFDRIKNIRGLFGEMKRFVLGRNQWMRPDKHLNISGLKRIIKKCSKKNEYIMFMVHSSELMPGGSPNFKHKDDIENLYIIIEKCFSYAKEMGYTGCTLSEYYSILNSIK